MKLLLRLWLAVFAFLPLARADEAQAKALKQVIESLAKLDSVYLAVHGKKSPLKELETELLAAKGPLVAAASAGGVSPDLAREIQACAALFEKSAQLMAADKAEEQAKFFRAGDDLSELSRLASTLGGAVAPAGKLTVAERRELGQLVESLFGRKMVEYPRGDVSPFASGSRSPFAQAMWTINLAFDATLKR